MLLNSILLVMLTLRIKHYKFKFQHISIINLATHKKIQKNSIHIHSYFTIDPMWSNSFPKFWSFMHQATLFYSFIILTNPSKYHSINSDDLANYQSIVITCFQFNLKVKLNKKIIFPALWKSVIQ